jgi:hypothetical protein
MVVRQCCVCQKVFEKGEWVVAKVDDLPFGEITHGYCDLCCEDLKRSILEYRKISQSPSISAAA